MDEVETLSRASRGSVVAAAGCGKTELIAMAAGRSESRQLILTHTNAGVDAIRRRLRRRGVPSAQVAVDTLDGWCLKYVAAYPLLSGGVPLDGDGVTKWAELRVRMCGLLGRGVIQRIVECSYGGILVDEYQDCVTGQHAVVSILAEFRDVRILGDPLQAVFGWDEPLPSWSASVTSTFPSLLVLTRPWRWLKAGGNVALGEWLAEARAAIEGSGIVRFSDPRLRLIRISKWDDWPDATRNACFEVAGGDETSLVVCKWPANCHEVGAITGGYFQCVESIEAKDGAVFLEELERAAAGGRPEVILSFARTVAVKVADHLLRLRAALNDGKAPGEALAALMALRAVGSGAGPEEAATALETVLNLSGVRVFRRELVWAVLDTLREADGLFKDLKAALRERRNHASHVGRRLSRRTVGTTLLVKGMEFDHAIVVHTGGSRGFTAKDLYVALTRGSRSLTVVSMVDTVDVASLPG